MVEMQPELLPVSPRDETEEAFKNRLQRLYRLYGQDWRPFFEQLEKRLPENEDNVNLPWWIIRKARQFGSSSGVER
jgi:hypothetical protein